jgi:D-alanine transaminase
LKIVMREVIRRNDVRDGIVYLQIARGIAPHDHAFSRSVNPVLS